MKYNEGCRLNGSTLMAEVAVAVALEVAIDNVQVVGVVHANTARVVVTLLASGVQAARSAPAARRESAVLHAVDPAVRDRQPDEPGVAEAHVGEARAGEPRRQDDVVRVERGVERDGCDLDVGGRREGGVRGTAPRL